MFVVTVEFEIHVSHLDKFMSAMKQQAETSLAQEPECHRFDVCQDPDSIHRIFLYELYTDRQAFDQHLATEHFKQFDESVKSWVVSKKVNTWELM
ncbi:MAG: putative quinol monooxygenase [Planctomycetota bacterium]